MSPKTRQTQQKQFRNNNENCSNNKNNSKSLKTTSSFTTLEKDTITTPNDQHHDANDVLDNIDYNNLQNNLLKLLNDVVHQYIRFQ